MSQISAASDFPNGKERGLDFPAWDQQMSWSVLYGTQSHEGIRHHLDGLWNPHTFALGPKDDLLVLKRFSLQATLW